MNDIATYDSPWTQSLIVSNEPDVCTYSEELVKPKDCGDLGWDLFQNACKQVCNGDTMKSVRCTRMTVDCTDYGGYDMRDLCMHTCNEERRDALVEAAVVIGGDTSLEMVNEDTVEVLY